MAYWLGSEHYELITAWGNALLGHEPESEHMALLCNISTPSARALRHFEVFADALRLT